MCSKVLNGHIILTDTSITTILAPEMTYTPKIHVVRYKLGYIRFYNLLRCHRLYTMKWNTKRANSTLRTPASTPTTEKMKSQTSGVPFLLNLS